ncbi:CDP-glycerol glycerophosphotransferase family protein [Gemmatimonas sp.]|jgi:CDP-glycerol glycerophosphotransferase (TagB/SpsB family)|uniref:CDP-glycerol glycerophosphotransferase family protein n=1 Tax=Gemmatimonas sp. TaxID=1962908 RepID=UPI0037BE50C9
MNAPSPLAMAAQKTPAKDRRLDVLKMRLDSLHFDTVGRDLAHISKAVQKRPLVLFFGRPTFSDNSKYLFLAALEAARDYEVLWMTGTPGLARELTDHGLPCMNFLQSPIESVRLMLQATVAVFCENMNAAFGGNNLFVGALAGAEKIQLWHGISVKQLDLMLIPHLDANNMGFRNAVKLATRTDVFLSTSSRLDAFWAESFGSARMVRAGQPRNAVLLRDPTPHEMIGAALPPAQRAVLDDASVKKLIVVPTWQRGDPLFISTAPFFDRIVKWAERHNAAVFVKQHPWGIGGALPKDVPGRLYFLEAGVDVYPWMSRFDALITDYSSIMFDFLLTGKPVFTFDARTETDYGFEPDWSLVPNTPFRYTFDAQSMESVLDANFAAHPLCASQQQLCNELYETDPRSASSTLLRLIDHCNSSALTRDVQVIDPRTLS